MRYEVIPAEPLPATGHWRHSMPVRPWRRPRPVPVHLQRAKRSGKYPFATMRVGESFVMHPPHDAANLANTLYKCAQRRGIRITVIPAADHSCRVWRIA